MASTYRNLSCKGQEQITPAVGPIGHCIDDIIVATKLLINATDEKAHPQEEFSPVSILNDPFVAPMKFDNRKFDRYYSKEKLIIGYFIDNNLMKCSKPSREAILKTVNALEKEGHV
mmetsp:Transcript_35740/g.41358  ORF Transcript_35740/g.41358 Transcript_35740/m.41358 type:complete len:116 (-) Transcript_35740:520-867(-)